MNHNKCSISLLTLAALIVLCPVANRAQDQPGVSVDHTGAQLEGECKLVVRNLENDQTLTPLDIVKGTDCLGYLRGVRDAYDQWAEINNEIHAQFYPPACIPDRVTNEELVQVVLKFLDNYPNMLHESERHVVTYALVRAYPCKKSQ